MDFHIFRLKVYFPEQLNFNILHKSRTDIIKDVIFSLPSCEIRKGRVWSLGNLIKLDDSGIYFRIGRLSKSTVQMYKNGDFIDQQLETAPYTHVVMDIDYELCAITGNSKLAKKTTGIANQFIRLLNRTDKVSTYEVEFDIDEINDPKDFLEQLQNSYAVTRFWAVVSRPNLLDANRDFVKPLQSLVDNLSAERGKVELSGKELNTKKLEGITRSVASSGNNAGAWLIEEPDTKSVYKKLTGNPVMISEENIDNNEDKKALLDKVRTHYILDSRRFITRIQLKSNKIKGLKPQLS
ncbi:MAG: hypothetical protein ACOYCB_12715 [Fastidiosipilaceae bacterium]